jgi:hypothetical protein
MPIVDLTGKTFGRLSVVRMVGRRRSGTRIRILWRCKCQCGKSVTVMSGNLRKGCGHTTSCGCDRGNKFHGHCTGGQSKTYKSWAMMIQRCTNPKKRWFHRYGAIGVRVCDRWMAFENFLADLGERPEGTTLGRILDMGDYEPGNAFWQTPAEQGLAARNKRALLSGLVAA